MVVDNNPFDCVTVQLPSTVGKSSLALRVKLMKTLDLNRIKRRPLCLVPKQPLSPMVHMYLLIVAATPQDLLNCDRSMKQNVGQPLKALADACQAAMVETVSQRLGLQLMTDVIKKQLKHYKTSLSEDRLLLQISEKEKSAQKSKGGGNTNNKKKSKKKSSLSAQLGLSKDSSLAMTAHETLAVRYRMTRKKLLSLLLVDMASSGSSSAGSSAGSSAQGVVSGSLVEEGWLGLIGWQWYFLISSLPLLVAAVLVYKFIYESPRYHAAIGRHATAKQLVEDLYAMNGHSRPEVLSVVSWKNGGAHPYRSNQPPTTQMLPWDRLCCSSSTLGLYAVWICKAGGSWGAAFWMPTYVERRIKLDALNEIKHTVGETYYVNTLSSTTPYRLLVFQSLCDAVGIALAALLINKVGRRLSLQASFLCAGCALLLLTMVTGEIAVLLMSGTMQFAQAIAWVVLVLHTAESFATSIRTTAMGFASTAARIGAIGAPIICGTWGWFVGVLSFLLLLACFLIVWDVCFF